MAVIRQRINRKNEAGKYDTIHLETSASSVLMGDGRTLEATLSDMSGGTDNTELLKTINSNILGVKSDVAALDTKTGNVAAALETLNGEVSRISTVSPITLGGVYAWAGHMCTAVHVTNTLLYLARKEIYEMCPFGTTNVYKGSNLAARAAAFQNSLPAAALSTAVNTTVNGVTAKIFVCSYEQANGGFDYFAVQGQRVGKNANAVAVNWWTSSKRPPADEYTKDYVYYVSTTGHCTSTGVSGGNEFVTKSVGFRPFVALRL